MEIKSQIESDIKSVKSKYDEDKDKKLVVAFSVGPMRKIECRSAQFISSVEASRYINDLKDEYEIINSPYVIFCNDRIVANGGLLEVCYFPNSKGVCCFV